MIGINTETLDGNADAIATAKDILQTKGATYRNIYFDSSSDAGTFALGIMAFPTTYVFDRNGNAVGEPLLGASTTPIIWRSFRKTSTPPSPPIKNKTEHS